MYWKLGITHFLYKLFINYFCYNKANAKFAVNRNSLILNSIIKNSFQIILYIKFVLYILILFELFLNVNLRYIKLSLRIINVNINWINIISIMQQCLLSELIFYLRLLIIMFYLHQLNMYLIHMLMILIHQFGLLMILIYFNSIETNSPVSFLDNFYSPVSFEINSSHLHFSDS